MPAESETYEHKSVYGGTDKERLKLVKSIVAMANTEGGNIHIERVTARARELDSASLDNIVNRYVGPAIHGIESEVQLDGFAVIRVAKSDQKPHVITRYAGYQEEQGRQKAVFHKGQIWVRHSSSNAEAAPDDVAMLIRGAAGRLLEQLGARIQQPGFVLRPEDEGAMPVRLASDQDAVPVRVDTPAAYPHTRRTLSDEIGCSVPWVTAAMQSLNLENDGQYAYSDRNAVGHAVLWRYSDEARLRLLSKLDEHPDWDPRRDG
ncbi:MAG: ATP-binding protein [Planctomycetes bacterium]|nr:ATP-binding protein [Planctomycetota bacterium]